MKTIIPAQPGFFAVYPTEYMADQIIAWEITHDASALDYVVRPITPAGLADEGYKIKYREARVLAPVRD